MPKRGLHYELLRIETHYQYYKRDGSWNYEPVKQTSRIADGAIDTSLDRPGHISMPVKWGRYRLEVSTGDGNGPVTSIEFDAGWYADASADTPDMLEIALDKGEYKPGDTMTVAVTARTAGRVTLNVIGDRLITTQTTDVQPGLAKLQVPVGRDWGNGAYVVATLRRPLDAVAQRMPGRAIGVQWFSVDRKAKTLALDMKMPALIRPNTTLRVPVKFDGLAAGEEARIVVAAVDVGILNLTNYKPPAPDDYFLGQRRLSADIRDLYGQLIDGMQGTRGQIRSGGDEGAQLQGSPPTQAPLALYSGVVTVGRDGNAEVAFDIPDFSGTVRVMAVAWSKDKVGRANGDVTVRDPVVVTATLPRFLLHGDRGTVHLDLDNVEGQAGDYTVAVTSEGPVVAGAGATQKVALRAKQRASISVPVAASGAGTSTVRVALCRAGRLRTRAQLFAHRALGDANPGAADRQADRQGREPDAVERHVQRPRARHRRRRRSRSGCRRRSMRRRCSRRSTAIRMAARSRSPAAPCRCSTSTSSPARRISPSTRRSTSASATPSTACWRGRAPTARSACGRSAATMPGSTPTSPTS